MASYDVAHPDDVGSATLPLEARLRLIELAAHLGEQEADRTWQRFGISLPLHAGLIAIVTYALSNDLFQLTVLIAVLGCFLSFIWYRIVTFSQFAEARWRHDMSALIDADPALADILRSRSSAGPRIERPRTSATDNAKIIVCGVGAFWLIVASYGAAHA